MNPKATTSGIQVGYECRNYNLDSSLAQVCISKGPLWTMLTLQPLYSSQWLWDVTDTTSKQHGKAVSSHASENTGLSLFYFHPRTCYIIGWQTERFFLYITAVILRFCIRKYSGNRWVICATNGESISSIFSFTEQKVLCSQIRSY